MRPNANLETTPSRSRKQSETTDRPYLTPTTFFLTRDPNIRRSSTTSQHTDQDSSPVRLLKQTLEEAGHHSNYTLPRHRQQEIQSNSRRRSTIKQHTTEESSSHGITIQDTTPSGALTPAVPLSQEPSLPGSPKSISSQSVAKSDDESTQDETGSQVIASSDDEQNEEASLEVQDSSPQLIMPSIKMPSRRPFTKKGKQLGRYKILVAGSKGCGRTSLIKSIVQLCDDIVHVDSVTSVTKTATYDRSNVSQTNPTIDEIYASTKPYPFWWSDIDESRILRRRKSVGDAVLERNICFVDTSNSGRPESVIQYLEQQMMKSVRAMNQAGNHLTSLLSGRGGDQVDVVLYLLTKDSLKNDQNNIRRMSRLCNVIPLIAKADQLTSEIITDLKSINLTGVALSHLPFSEDSDATPQAHAPYAVSSANGSDFDNMDASLLMSPEYVRPLIPSELSLLVEQLFNPTIVSYLRHTSSKKLVTWYASEPRLTQLSSPTIPSAQPSTLNSPLPNSLSNSGVLVPATSEFSLNTSNSYALAKVVDHTEREEHLAQIRLSKWASDLQLSLQRERDRYETLAQSERAIWLVQKMGEEIRNGQVVPFNDGQVMTKANEQSKMLYSELRYETHDPLGLLRWQDAVRTRGWAALQIIGSFGVVGGVALWLAKTWGFTTSLQEWAQGWSIQLVGTNE